MRFRIVNPFQDTQRDAVVIAEEWGGYAIAALLARSGKRVSLLTLPQQPGFPSSVLPSFSFSDGPSLFFGFESGGLAETLFFELGFSLPSFRKEGLYRRVSPSLQVVLPDHRLDISSEAEDFLEECRREFGPNYGGIRALFAELDQKTAEVYPAIAQISPLEPRGFRDRLMLYREEVLKRGLIKKYKAEKALTLIRSYVKDPEWESFLCLQSYFAFEKSLEEMTLLDFLALYGGLKRGVVRLVEGEKRLNKRLGDFIKMERGELIPVETPLKVQRSRDGSGEVVVEGKGSVKAQHIVVALTETGVEESGQRLGEFFMVFQVAQEAIPDPMKEDLVLSWEEGTSPIHHNYIALHLSLPDEEGSFEKGMRGLVASVLLTQEELQKDRLEDIEKAIEQRVRWLLPFSGHRLRQVSSSRCLPFSRGRSLLDSSLLKSLRPIRVGTATYYRSSKMRSLVVIPTRGAGKIERMAFVMTGLHFVKTQD